MRLDATVRRSMTLMACLLLSWAGPSRAQLAHDNPWFVRVGGGPGYILPDNPFRLTSNGANNATRESPNLTVEIGRQTDGGDDWHYVYGMPSYGFGMSFVSFRDGGTTGRPLEAYTFFTWPFVHLTDTVDLTTDFGMGVSWRWNETNGDPNTSERVLGSNLNARINWALNARYSATPRIVLFVGVDYTHRSNGGLVQPNQGINVIGPKVTAQYNFDPQGPRPLHLPRPPFHPAWELVIGGSGGMKNVVERSSPIATGDYGAFDLTTSVQRHFYRFGKIAVGTDLTYDGSTGALLDEEGRLTRASGIDRWGLGVYGGYEHVIDRFSVIVQVGDNVVRPYDSPDTRRLYARYGWRFFLTDRLWTMFAIRANDIRRANVLEFGAGIRLRRES